MSIVRKYREHLLQRYTAMSLALRWLVATLTLATVTPLAAALLVLIGTPLTCFPDGCYAERPVLLPVGVVTGVLAGFLIPLAHFQLLSRYRADHIWRVISVIIATGGTLILTVLLFLQLREPFCLHLERPMIVDTVVPLCIVQPDDNRLHSIQVSGSELSLPALFGAGVGALISAGYSAALRRRFYENGGWIVAQALGWGVGWGCAFLAAASQSYLVFGLGWLICWYIIAKTGSMAVGSLVRPRQTRRLLFLFEKFRKQVKSKYG